MGDDIAVFPVQPLQERVFGVFSNLSSKHDCSIIPTSDDGRDPYRGLGLDSDLRSDDRMRSQHRIYRIVNDDPGESVQFSIRLSVESLGNTNAHPRPSQTSSPPEIRRVYHKARLSMTYTDIVRLKWQKFLKDFCRQDRGNEAPLPDIFSNEARTTRGDVSPISHNRPCSPLSHEPPTASGTGIGHWRKGKACGESRSPFTYLKFTPNSTWS